jgi:ATP-dependent RNA helicase RhlE
MKNFAALELAEPLARALSDLGHNTPTPIQAQAIPPALDGRDVMGIAQTGTGKTAGFTLPTLNHLITEDKEPPKRGARVLILAPTRELASQIAESVRGYGRHMPHLSVSCVYGGVPIARQIKRLTGGNDVLVATPGRLIDLVDRKAIKLDGVEILILDEADQMLDMGFIHALKKIMGFIPKQRQTLFFSATLAPKIKQLSKQFLNDPVHVSVTPANRTADKVTQRMIKMSRAGKQDRLAVELLRPEVGRSLVFTRTKHGADRVVKRLAKVGIAAVAIHGNKNQNQRTRALEAFKSGKVDTLVATDVAARGIDIPLITHVFNFELPNVPEQYVHRIGRTARAEASGMAISFVATEKDSDEGTYLRDIEKLLKDKIPEAESPEDLEGDFKAMRARKALPKPEKPQQETRTGRGKSKKKKKGRFSKDKARKDSATRDGAKGEAQPRGRGNPSRAMPSQGSSGGDTPKKKHPPREGRSRQAPSRDGKPQSNKPKQMSGDASTETRSRKPKANPSGGRGSGGRGSGGRGSGGDGAPKRRRHNRRKGKPGGHSGGGNTGGSKTS